MNIKIYHGDNYNTTALNVMRMMTNTSNNQEGVGIYFSDDIEIAKSYGKNIISIEINKRKFVPSRDDANKHINKNKLFQLLKEITKFNREEMFYYISDYVEVYEPKDMTDLHLKKACEYILDNEIRNLQIDLAEIVGIKKFVELWNKIIKIDGTYYRNNSDV